MSREISHRLKLNLQQRSHQISILFCTLGILHDLMFLQPFCYLSVLHTCANFILQLYSEKLVGIVGSLIGEMKEEGNKLLAKVNIFTVVLVI